MQSNFSSQASGNTHSLEAEFQQIIWRRSHESLSAKRGWRGQLKRIGTALVDFLTGTQTLSIRSKALADGSVQWVAYDPGTDTRQVFQSEQAIRTWLEERYHR